MNVSLDFGASTIDVVYWNDSKIINIESFEREMFKPLDIKSFIFDFLVSKNFSLAEIFITGGRSSCFFEAIPEIILRRVNEIEAIGRGGKWLFDAENEGKEDLLLVVSMGTGTCMVKVGQKSKEKGQKTKLKNKKKLEITHVGGTGVGGGTFLGLCRELLGEVRIERLISMFQGGDRRKVDISVEEIVGSGIGLIPGNATASNLGKLSREIEFSKEDLASGIANLIGQTIGTAASFAAKANKCDVVLLTGKLTRFKKIVDTVFEVGKIYGIKMVIPKNAEYVAAIGAGI